MQTPFIAAHHHHHHHRLLHTMEFKLIRSRIKRQSSSGNGSSKSSRPARPAPAKSDDMERLRRRNHDHNTSHKYLRSSDQRIQPAILAAGHRKYAHTYPPRGTLDDGKLEYLTWRMHLLFAKQTGLDDEAGVTLEQQCGESDEAGAVSVTVIEANLQRHMSTSSTTYSDSLQSTASSSCSSKQPRQREEDELHAAIAMSRDAAAEGNTEPGWIEAGGAISMMADAKRALTQALITDNALAAIPLLECEERHFKMDRHQRCHDARHSGDSSSTSEQDMMAAAAKDDTLPPPLMPASMFYRASFGIRTKPKRTQSSQSVPTTKVSVQTSPSLSRLRSIFRIQPRRTHSDGPSTLFTLGSAPLH